MSVRWYRFFFFFLALSGGPHPAARSQHKTTLHRMSSELCSDYMNVLGGIGTGHVCWGRVSRYKVKFYFCTDG